MIQEDFDKAYFKAKLQGIDGLGELLLQLMKAEEHKFAMQLFQLHNKNYKELLCNEAVSEKRVCEKSPYKYCFCVPLGQNIEQMDPDALFCIWCDRIFGIDLTEPETTYIENGRIIDDTSMLMHDDLKEFVGFAPPKTAG